MFLASLFMLLIVLILLVAAFLFIYPIKVAASFNSEKQPDIHLIVSWLSPFFKGYITRHDGRTALTVKLFNKRIIVKNLASKKDADYKSSKKNSIEYIKAVRSLKVTKAKIFASYGFEDPSVTGMLFGAIEFVSQYVNTEEFYNNADFFTLRGYFNISASAEINAGVSLIRILRHNMPHTGAHSLSEQS